MTTFEDIRKFFQEQHMRLIIAADGETITHVKKNNTIVGEIPAGGVSNSFEAIAKASEAIYVARGKTYEDKSSVDKENKYYIRNSMGNYTLKRVFLTEKELTNYYYGYSNQTLWPLCHAAFEKPIFHNRWFEGYKAVNKKFADSIQVELKPKTFIWINDYQLCLVPKFISKPKETILAMFWHIPWPTWEIFRILPEKHIILESLLNCDFIGFHRGYQMRNFVRTVERELEARFDQETNKIYYNKHITRVYNLPLGIDTEAVSKIADKNKKDLLFLKNIDIPESHKKVQHLFENYSIILGIDRLDYTKGLLLRMNAIGRFFDKNPIYRGKVVYISILAPSRQLIPAYRRLHRNVDRLALRINTKYQSDSWRPIEIIIGTFKREEIINYYEKAKLILVTPLDDGMNLVSKEYIIAASESENPGMLILSQFAGSAIDLTSAIIINPYDRDELSQAIKKGLEMPKKEKVNRIKSMRETLEENNIYEWARNFIKAGQAAAKGNNTLVK